MPLCQSNEIRISGNGFWSLIIFLMPSKMILICSYNWESLVRVCSILGLAFQRLMVFKKWNEHFWWRYWNQKNKTWILFSLRCVSEPCWVRILFQPVFGFDFLSVFKIHTDSWHSSNGSMVIVWCLEQHRTRIASITVDDGYPLGWFNLIIRNISI